MNWTKVSLDNREHSFGERFYSYYELEILRPSFLAPIDLVEVSILVDTSSIPGEVACETH